MRRRKVGGAPARLMPDDLKTGVARPDPYDPQVKRCYGELAEHYGVLGRPGAVVQASR